jgi:hypothetical protein
LLEGELDFHRTLWIEACLKGSAVVSIGAGRPRVATMTSAGFQSEIFPARCSFVHDSSNSTAEPLLDVHWWQGKEGREEDALKRLVAFPSDSGEPILVSRRDSPEF